MKKFPFKILLAASLVIGLTQPTLAADEDNLISGASGTMLSNTCAGCHGTDGVSSGPSIPTIAGLAPSYFTEIMEAYKLGDVPSTIMGRIASGYSDEEIEAMAEYYGKQKYVAATQESDAEKAKLGAELHDKHCEKCHTESGTVQDDEAGFLKGQWKSYLAAQFMDFQSGDREAPKKMAKALKKVADKHGDAGIEALLEYYSSK